MENKNNLQKIINIAYSKDIEWKHKQEGPGKGIYFGKLNAHISFEIGRYNGSPTQNQNDSDFFYFKIKGTMPEKPFTLEEINGDAVVELYNCVEEKYKRDQKELKKRNKDYFDSILCEDNLPY